MILRSLMKLMKQIVYRYDILTTLDAMMFKNIRLPPKFDCNGLNIVEWID